MSDYKLPRRTEKPWGYELLFALSPHYAGKILFVRKGHRLSLQYHKIKDESLYIQDGKALLEIEDANGNMEQTEAIPGTAFRLQPKTKHRFQAIEDTTFLEVSTPELDDVVRLDDDYGRKVT